VQQGELGEQHRAVCGVAQGVGHLYLSTNVPGECPR